MPSPSDPAGHRLPPRVPAPATGTYGRRTLVVIPALDEEQALPGVLEELASQLPCADILVVDDGSTDGTAAAARKAGVAVAELPFHVGIGGALQTGFRYAVRHGYEGAVQFDADGQHDATQVRTLLQALEAGADLVIGNRFADAEDSYDVGRVRGRAMGVLRVLVRLLSGQRFVDTSSGFRAFSARMLQYFAKSYPTEYLDSVESLLLACRAGFRVVEVPVHMRPRTMGSPSTRSYKLLYHYLRVIVSMIGQGAPRAENRLTS
ncbi:MAG TPA: glycosyltransferase family 2 protein [Acidimicrobiales bacterium]|nr:glycosyltransferase family 2 protein [Acidimicrobiales bacterium]